LPHKTHQDGTLSEIIVSEYLVGLGFYVFSPVVHQPGPIDIIAINEAGDMFLIDAKTDSRRRINPGRTKPARIHRVKSDTQKRLKVIYAYVKEDRTIDFIPPLV